MSINASLFLKNVDRDKVFNLAQMRRKIKERSLAEIEKESV